MIFKPHYRLERHTIGFALGIILVASIGGAVEIAPLFTIDETVEHDPNMRVYTPLELAGRNIYIREGCYSCHSQMIRTLRDEVERYGPFSLAVESQYDHPMQWGSKRTGPDLARIGGKYSDQWQVAHLADPRAVVPQSVMPAYAWMARTRLETRGLSGHLRAQRRVGVPYSDAMIEHAEADAVAQASPDLVDGDGLVERYGAAMSSSPISRRPSTSPTPTRRSTSACSCTIPGPPYRWCGTRGASSSARTVRRRLATTPPARATSCRLVARRASRRRSTSASSPRSSALPTPTTARCGASDRQRRRWPARRG